MLSCVPFSDTKVVDLHGDSSDILTIEATVKGYESSFFGTGITTHVSGNVKWEQSVVELIGT